MNGHAPVSRSIIRHKEPGKQVKQETEAEWLPGCTGSICLWPGLLSGIQWYHGKPTVRLSFPATCYAPKSPHLKVCLLCGRGGGLDLQWLCQGEACIMTCITTSMKPQTQKPYQQKPHPQALDAEICTPKSRAQKSMPGNPTPKKPYAKNHTQPRPPDNWARQHHRCKPVTTAIHPYTHVYISI